MPSHGVIETKQDIEAVQDQNRIQRVLPLQSGINSMGAQDFGQNIKDGSSINEREHQIPRHELRPPAIKRQTKQLSLSIFDEFKKGYHPSDDECHSPLIPARHSHVKQDKVTSKIQLPEFRPRLMTCDETLQNYTNSNVSDRSKCDIFGEELDIELPNNNLKMSQTLQPELQLETPKILGQKRSFRNSINLTVETYNDLFCSPSKGKMRRNEL
jgi:hypothetical protein